MCGIKICKKEEKIIESELRKNWENCERLFCQGRCFFVMKKITKKTLAHSTT